MMSGYWDESYGITNWWERQWEEEQTGYNTLYDKSLWEERMEQEKLSKVTQLQPFKDSD